MNISLSVIGGGNMARAIIEGAIRGGILGGNEIALADPNETSRSHFDALGCLTVSSAEELPKSSTVLLAVKPQVFEFVASQVSCEIIYSIMAGVTTDSITKSTGVNKVVRVMPNLPCSVGFGAAGIALGSNATEDDATLAMRLFSEIGVVVKVQESLMDAVTAISGSGPAYLFLLAESMIQGGLDAGLDIETATKLVQQTVRGASELLAKDCRTATELREAVTSHGGTTAAALSVMNDRGVSNAIRDAVIAARDRGVELGS